MRYEIVSQDGLVSRELLSALADGQLDGAEFAQVVASATRSDEGLAAWHAYHVVGDVLRCTDLAACGDDRAFVERLRVRLVSDGEGENFRARMRQAGLMASLEAPVAVTASPETKPRDGANDEVKIWKLLAGVASIAAVATLGWHLSGGVAGFGQPAQLAAFNQLPAAIAVPASSAAAQAPVMLRDARLDELLAAHKQFGGTSALQMPAGFLRNATFESPGR